MLLHFAQLDVQVFLTPRLLCGIHDWLQLNLSDRVDKVIETGLISYSFALTSTVRTSVVISALDSELDGIQR
jgi:hypothetical protein